MSYIEILTFALMIHIDSDKVAFKILKCRILGIEQSGAFLNLVHFKA